jgi:hypothetical protein
VIRPNAALTRQAQEMFRNHLVGCYGWEEVTFAPPEKNERPQPFITPRGRRRRAEPAEGKYRHLVCMEFGIWQIRIEGPEEHPPLGWIMMDGRGEIEGPLDPETWNKIGRHIKTKHEELKNVA